MHTPSSLSALFSQYLLEHPFAKAPQALYEPIDYIMGLGGKRLRPLLLLLSYSLFEENHPENALPAAMAVEVFHNFTLMHDDIMDEAPTRRGKPTVHEQYNVNTAILSGDVMLIRAYQFLQATRPVSLVPDLLGIFNQVAVEVCEGQQYDVNFEKSTTVTIPEYLHMIELKTAVLLAGAMKMGALIAGATPEDAEHLYEFGRNTGIAFQLQDDILDTFGDPEKFGKRIGGDIVQNKKTFLILQALQIASPADRSELLRWMSDTPAQETEKIRAVTALLRKLDIPAQASAVKEQYQKAAFKHLDAIAVADSRKQALRTVAADLLNRDY